MLQDAEQLAERLAVSHGGTAELLCEQGELAHARGQWHRGAELWMELRRTHPSFQPTRVVTRAAYALEQSGHEAEARQLLRARALEVAMEKLQREPTDLSLLTVAMLQDASNSGPSRPGGSE
jgi:hypothetical protein